MARIGGFSVGNNQVFLNVYDLHENNDMLFPWGLGFYHSGVQVGREEYTFASSAGIFTHSPKNAPGARFRTSIDMGVFKGTTKDLETIIQSLRPYYKGDDYHILNKNCNNFANDFLVKIVGREAPSYVNRMAYLGSFCSCLMPPQQANQAPVDAGSGRNTGSGPVYSPVSTGNPSYSSRNTSAPTTSFSTPGRKLGSSSENGSMEMGLQDRRERMRAAVASRMAANASNGSR